MDVLASDSHHQRSLQLLATSLVAQDHPRISSSQLPANSPVSQQVRHYQRSLSPDSPVSQQASHYRRILSSNQLPATSIEDESFFEVDVANDDLSDCDEDNKNDDGANEDNYRGDDAYDGEGDDEQDSTFSDSTASNYLAPQQRFKWTTKEINFVGQWCKKTIKETKNKVNIVARCYSYICANDDVKKLFHPHHIARGDRLYYAFKTYNKSN